MKFNTEKEMEDYFESYLIRNGWEVKRQAKRTDTLTWKYPITADLIARHPMHKELGWIGFELKNKVIDEFKQFTNGFKQIITKYQCNSFENLQRIDVWILVVDSKYQNGWTIPIQNFFTRFGVGLLYLDSNISCAEFVTNQNKFSLPLQDTTHFDLNSKFDLPSFMNFIIERTSWKKFGAKELSGGDSE